MPPAKFRPSAKPPSGRYLSFAEREEIAILRVQGHSMQEVGRRLGRSASTISRELRRNAATRSGGLEYRATTAQWHADRSALRPKPTKLAVNPVLRTYVEERLAGVVVAPSGVAVAGPAVSWKGRRHGRRQDRRWARAWSPEQIARYHEQGLLVVPDMLSPAEVSALQQATDSIVAGAAAVVSRGDPADEAHGRSVPSAFAAPPVDEANG